MRLGIFGGSFDPIHWGHLLLAETCREEAGLDEVWFVPAAQSPHKRTRQATPGEHRRQMIRLATDGNSAFQLHDGELVRGGVSYTVDTLAAIRAERPDDELFLLLGADACHDFPKWRAPDQICSMARLLVVHRAGTLPPQLDVLAPCLPSHLFVDQIAQVVPMPQMDVSSREIRRRISERRSIRYRVPRAVEEYIRHAGLYLSPEPS